MYIHGENPQETGVTVTLSYQEIRLLKYLVFGGDVANPVGADVEQEFQDDVEWMFERLDE